MLKGNIAEYGSYIIYRNYDWQHLYHHLIVLPEKTTLGGLKCLLFKCVVEIERSEGGGVYYSRMLNHSSGYVCQHLNGAWHSVSLASPHWLQTELSMFHRDG